MSFARYPEYRDSGVQWLGELPVGWQIWPLKYLATIENGRDHKDIEVDEGVPVYGSGGPFAFAADYLYDGPSVLLGRKGTIDKPLWVNAKFWTVDTMYWTRIGESASPRFFYYVALMIPFSMYATSTALPSMTKSLLGAHMVAVPPLSEQSAIASFLDYETARIDALVAEQERLIELLREKRLATISLAVTSGLRHDVTMIETPVEGLPRLPAHWKLVALKRLGSIRYGIGEPPVYRQQGVPLIRATNVHAGNLFDEGLVFVDPEDIPAQRVVWLSAGDIIVVRSGAYTGDSAIIPDGYGPCIAGFDMVVRCSRINPNFLQFALLSTYLRSFQIDLVKLRAAQPHLNAEELGACIVAVPPLSEQTAIVQFLVTELSRIDSLIRKAEEAIELMRERRSALISAAVIGQIDVRGLVEAAAA